MEQHPLFRMYLELNDKINALSSLGGVSGSVDLSDIIVRLKDLESRPSFDTEIANLKNVIQNLETSNNELKDKIAYLTKVDTIEGRVYNLENEPKVNHEAINGRLDVIENGNYQEKIVNITNRLNNLEQVAGAVNDLSYRLTEVERRPDLTERVNGLELTISTLHS